MAVVSELLVLVLLVNSALLLFMYTHVYRSTCVNVHVEAADQPFSQPLSTLFFETRSLTKSEAHLFGKTG